MSPRWHLPPDVHTRFRQELADSRTARRDGDGPRAWRHLERAHILGQMAVWPHVRVHLAMLWAAILDTDAREVGGQLIRILRAGPGSYAGTVPIGDTGRTRSTYPPPPVPDDLLAILSDGGIQLPAARPASG